MKVVGLDLSLTATGAAIIHNNTITVHTVCDKTPATGLAERLTRLNQLVWTLADLCEDADLVVVEGPALGAGRQAGTHERAGLWWLMIHELHHGGGRVAEVPPASLKRYLTGRGNAAKDTVLIEVARRFPTVQVTNNNEADALGLAAMGAEELDQPIVRMPAAHRAALSTIYWPETRP